MFSKTNFPGAGALDLSRLELKADAKAGRYMISKIFAGENWNESTRSPLTEQGIGVQVGDYLIALNGSEVMLPDNPYRFLENTVGRKVDRPGLIVSGSGRPTGSPLRGLSSRWVDMHPKIVQNSVLESGAFRKSNPEW